MKPTIEKLITIFSEYIRLRDADEYGMITCISCGKRVKWKEADAGHFIPCANMSLRFDPKNVHAQCKICNQGKYGNIEGYKSGLMSRYGMMSIFYLEEKKHEMRHWSDYEIELMILHYTKEVKQLKMLHN